MPKPIETKAGLARELGIHVTNITKYIKKGMPVNVDGTFDVEKVQAWRQSRKEGVILNNADKQVINTDQFKANRAEILVYEQAQDIKRQQLIRDEILVREKIKTMPDNALVSWFEKLGRDQDRKYMQERLEKGESTENVAVLVRAIKDAKKRLRGGNGSKRVEESTAQDQGSVGDTP